MKHLRLFLLACLPFLTGPIYAAQIVYTLTGQLQLGSGSDDLNLDGALFTGIYVFDLNAAPVYTATGDVDQPTLTFTDAGYQALSTDFSFTGRSNGASAASVSIADNRLPIDLAFATNSYQSNPLPTGDSLSFNDYSIQTPDIGSFYMDAISILFNGLDYFAGTGFASLPQFAPGDVVGIQNSVGSNSIIFGPSSGYQLVGAEVSATVVSLPAAFWLFGSGLLALVGIPGRKGI